MSFPRYPKYKESGVAWLGEVPAHWDVQRLKFLADIQTGERDTENAVEDGMYPFFVRSQTVERINSCAFNCEALFTAGDGAGVGKVFHHYEGPFDFHQRVYMLNNFLGLSGKFMFHYLRENFYKVALEGGAKSTVDSLRRPLFTNFAVTVPPPAEQTAIVDFVVKESQAIDRLVAEQERLIELLKEKRRAVISHAVTKGLNPDAPMKPSGIDWLGDIPSAWTLRRFQRCVYVAEGQVDPEDLAYSGLPLIAPNHVESGTGRLLNLESASEQGAESGKYRCEAGDVVYSKIRPALRKVCIAPEDCLCSADMYPLRAHSGLINHFLLWTILSENFSAFAVLESERVAMPKINRESLKEVTIALPPLAEQREIVNFLERETAGLDALASEVARTIELLQERRAALISAAVTGQIDVRGYSETKAA
jgi:type I restriction enzyme S subunit